MPTPQSCMGRDMESWPLYGVWTNAAIQSGTITMPLTRRAFSASLGAAAASLGSPGILRAAEPLVVGYVLANSMHWAQCVAIEKGYYKDVGFEPQAATMQ